MKICDLTQSYTESGGGIKTYIHEKKKFLCRHRDDEHLLIIPGEDDRVLRDGRFTTYQVASPLIPGCDPYRLLWRKDKLWSILKTEQPDIIEYADPYLAPWLARRCQQSWGAKVVGFYHTDLPGAYVRSLGQKLVGITLASWLEKVANVYIRRAYRMNDVTITASSLMHGKLQTLNMPSLEIIPLGIDPDMFHPGKRSQRLRESLGVAAGEILLMYAGRFDHEKRVLVLVEALKRMPQDLRLKLVLIGNGPLRTELEMQQRCDARMHVLPYQSDKQQLAACLASADIYLTAGPSETFGLSVLEAQACALPVIGVRSGALLERVSPGTGLLGAVDSAEAMAENIRRMLALDHRGMGHYARRLVESRYSWDACFLRIVDLYDDLLGERGDYLSRAA